MGERGPLPLSAREQALRGRRGEPRTLADATPVSEPRMPRGLDPEARREWRRVTALLRERGVLHEVDRAVLTLYCRTWSRWLQVDAALGEAYLHQGAKSTIMNPLARLYRDLAQLLKELGAQLGVTPAARLRLPAPPQQEEEDDPLLELMRRGREARRGA